MRLKFENIAYNITTKRNPVPEDSKLYVGLEHMDAGSLYITRYGLDVDIKGSKLVMCKGDVLLGKRNAYLRRAAIAPHDGLFSAHGMILRPKEDVIDKNFFPFFVASDRFFDEVIRISVGGLSPTVNWKDLKNLEFDLPSLSEQKILADKLWAAYRLKESYKKLLAATDEMVKSQFIEMFISNKSNDWKLLQFNDFAFVDVNMTTDFETYADYPHIGIDSIQQNSGELVGYRTVAEDNVKSGKYIFTQNHIIYSKIRPNLNKVAEPDFEGLCSADAYPILAKEDVCRKSFLVRLLRSDIFLEYILPFSKRTGMPKVNREQVEGFSYEMPPIELQDKFLSIAKQADKSKLELRKSIEAIDAVIKSLINN